MSDDDLFKVWKKGWDSAAQVAELAINDLLDPHSLRFEDRTVVITQEKFDKLKERMAEGLYKNMKLSEGGLDYYLAATDPKELATTEEQKNGQ